MDLGTSSVASIREKTLRPDGGPPPQWLCSVPSVGGVACRAGSHADVEGGCDRRPQSWLLGEGPLQVPIDVGSHTSVARTVAAGMNTRRCSGIAGQVRRVGESADITDLHRNRGGRNYCNSWQSHQALHIGSDIYQLLESALQLSNLQPEKIQLLKQLLTDPTRLWGQSIEILRQLRSTSFPEWISGLAGRHSILGKCGRQPILQSGALLHEYATSARQLSEVTQPARGNPHGGQGATPLESIQTVGHQACPSC